MAERKQEAGTAGQTRAPSGVRARQPVDGGEVIGVEPVTNAEQEDQPGEWQETARKR